MTPNQTDIKQIKKIQIPTEKENSWQWNDVIWKNVIIFTILHIYAIYGLYQLIFICQWKTVIYTYLLIIGSGSGMAAGTHRLFAHRSYKARLPLKILLAACHTMACQYDIYSWARDHRTHHKFSETNADPYNPKRGIFYAHIGWLFLKRHPMVIEKARQMNFDDLKSDPIVQFQRRHFKILSPILGMALPMWIPCHFWGESPWISWNVAVIFRIIYCFNAVFILNSVSHFYGDKPYDKTIGPTENLKVSIITCGEGWHNFHHLFPWDYRTSEYSCYGYSLTTPLIDFMARIGWAYDLKVVSRGIVEKRRRRTGDGSFGVGRGCKGDVWGWGDEDVNEGEVGSL